MDYRKVEKLIWDTCLSFRRSHGGDLDDLIGEAHVAYMLCLDSYNPARSKFGTWVRNKVWFALLERARSTARYHGRFPMECRDAVAGFDDIATRSEPDEFDTDGFLAALGDDARMVAALALEPNIDIRLDCECRKGRDETKIRKSVTAFLRGCGWEPERIAAAFAEVRSAL